MPQIGERTTDPSVSPRGFFLIPNDVSPYPICSLQRMSTASFQFLDTTPSVVGETLFACLAMLIPIGLDAFRYALDGALE